MNIQVKQENIADDADVNNVISKNVNERKAWEYRESRPGSETNGPA
jgi:hypothetical protein